MSVNSFILNTLKYWSLTMFSRRFNKGLDFALYLMFDVVVIQNGFCFSLVYLYGAAPAVGGVAGDLHPLLLADLVPFVYHLDHYENYTPDDTSQNQYEHASHVFEAQCVRCFLVLFAVEQIVPQYPFVVQRFHYTT